MKLPLYLVSIDHVFLCVFFFSESRCDHWLVRGSGGVLERSRSALDAGRELGSDPNVHKSPESANLRLRSVDLNTPNKYDDITYFERQLPTSEMTDLKFHESKSFDRRCRVAYEKPQVWSAAADVKMEIPVLRGSLKSSILSSTCFQMDASF